MDNMYLIYTSPDSRLGKILVFEDDCYFKIVNLSNAGKSEVLETHYKGGATVTKDLMRQIARWWVKQTVR